MIDFDNPYFEEVAGGVVVGSSRVSIRDNHLQTFKRREQLIDKYSYAIPNTEAIQALVSHDPIIEVGAGDGYWAWCVEQAGGDIIATDVDPPDDPWTEVQENKAQGAAAAYPHRTLFICWPTYNHPWSDLALRAYDGATVIYVGEGRNGATGTQLLHDMLFDDWELDETVNIPTYYGLRDRLEVWVR